MFADALSAAGVETTHGLSWSMHAIYRETRTRKAAGGVRRQGYWRAENAG